MKTNTVRNIVATAYGADTWLPLVTGEIDARQWVESMAGKTVTTKNGFELSVVRDTLFKSQMALTNMALALRAATELGMLPYTKAVHEARNAYRLVEQFSLGFAAFRQENHRELVAAEVAIKVKDGCFDQLTAEGAYYTEEELLESGYDYEEIENILEAQELNQVARNSGDRQQSMSADEGILRTALHDVSQLWDIELQAIEWAEAFTAKVALIGKQWPTANAAWDVVLDRLAESWAASIEYASTDEVNAMEAAHAASKGRKFTAATTKEEVQKKIERRMTALDDLHAKPMYARWAVNHVTRRVWRDIKALERTKQRFEEQADRMERQVFAEERYGVPASITRPNMGEATELDRVQYLPFGQVNEADVGFGVDMVRMSVKGDGEAQAFIDTMPHYDNEGMHFRIMDASRGERDMERDTQENRNRAWFTAVIEACDNQLALVKPVYKELRDLDLSLSKLWELFNDEGRMPSAPPVYWNARGHYLTEEDACNALLIEQAEFAAKNRMADDDAAMAAIQLMLANK